MSALARATPAHCAGSSDGPVPVTIFTSDRGSLTKRFEIGDDGSLKSETAAQLVSGSAETVSVRGLDGLRCMLDGLRSHQAISFGTCGLDSARLTTQKRLPDKPGAIARDRDHFAWADGPGFMLLDYDCPADEAGMPREALIEALRSAMPELARVPLLWSASTSSNIVNAETGAELRGTRGQHLYLTVGQASEIPRIAEILSKRLWLAGFGRFAVSKSGALLPRTLIDAAVFQPERLIFSGASCGTGLEQRRPPRAIIPAADAGGGEVLRAAAVPALTAAETARYERMVGEARAAAQPEAERVKAVRRAQLAGDLAAGGTPREEAAAAARGAVDGGVLGGPFKLLHESGAVITVAELLSEPERWHEERFHDPLESEYRGDARIAVALLASGRPCLFSHAHGGRRFELQREAAVIEVRAGEEARMVDESLQALARTFEVFDSPDGSAVLTVDAEGRMRLLDADAVHDALARRIAFRRPRPRFGGGFDLAPADVPRRLPSLILARAGRRGLPRLRGVITAPCLRADGSLIDRPGYDRDSGLLAAFDDAWSTRWRVPTVDAAVAAFATLWAPVSQFPCASAVDRAVLAAALLTAVTRPTLGLAPALGFTAPAPGSGKTLLASVLGVLGTGHAPAATPWPASEAEGQKLLFALAREGCGVVLIDNIERPLGSAALNAMLTAGAVRDRVLGSSATATAPFNGLLMLTGNNLVLTGDLNRRALCCRLDAGTETPWTRRFDCDPLAWVRDARRELVDAGLTVLRGYIAAGRPRVAAGGLASFEQWDSTIRQAVVWLARLPGLGVELGDPADAIAAGFERDPVAGRLGAVLTAWWSMFGDSPMRVQDAVRVVEASRQGFAAFGPATAPADDLWDAFLDVAGERGCVNARRLGTYLAAHEARRVDGYAVERGGSHARAVRWRVVQR